MAYVMKKAQLLAQMRMFSGKKPPQKIQVPKVIPKPVKKIAKSAQQIARIARIKALKKKNMMTLSDAKAKLPEPPAGTSTARRLQDPRHADIVKALVKVPSMQDMGLRKEGELLYSKMMEATTRGLSATSGSQYFRYVKYM